MKKARKAYIKSCEVSELKTYHLGGFDQKVLVEGRHKNAPILLFLHGGPGSPIPFCAGCRGLFPAISDKFLMVYWDQLGCGINNHPVDNKFSVSDFVKMTVELVGQLRADFPGNPVILFGMSWGSILAVKAAVAAPEQISGVLTWGQVLKMPNFSDAAFDTLERANLPGKVRNALAEIRRKPRREVSDAMHMSAWLRKYTEGFQAKTGEKSNMGSVIRGILQSPDYSFRDFCAIMVNGYRKNTSLIYEVMDADLSADLEKVAVPYEILQGEKDLVTSTADISDFMGKTANPNLRLEIVPDNSHMPGTSGMDAVLAKLEHLAAAVK